MSADVVAWLARDNRIYVPNSADGYPYGLTDERGETVEGRRELPAGAVPLVPENELHEAQEAAAWAGEMLASAQERNAKLRAEVERLKAERDDPYSEVNDQAGAWREVAKHPVIGPIYALPERDTYALRVKARLDQIGEMATAVAEMTTATSPELPALNTPEALRYAAEVAKARGLFNSAHEMAGMASRQEAAARTDAEREARIEDMARALHECQPYVWGQKWEFLSVPDRTAILESAAALDAVGYRKTDGT